MMKKLLIIQLLLFLGLSLFVGCEQSKAKQEDTKEKTEVTQKETQSGATTTFSLAN